MKTRKGFVSNSSSSSFIVAFKEIPKSEVEVHQLLFGNKCCFSCWDETHSAKDAAARVFDDIQINKEEGFLNLKEITKEIASGWTEINDQVQWPSFDIKDPDERRQAWDIYHNKVNQLAREKAKKFIKDNEGCKFLIFTYSDHDGPLISAMEHGYIFRNLPRIRVSHH